MMRLCHSLCLPALLSCATCALAVQEDVAAIQSNLSQTNDKVQRVIELINKYDCKWNDENGNISDQASKEAYAEFADGCLSLLFQETSIRLKLADRATVLATPEAVHAQTIKQQLDIAIERRVQQKQMDDFLCAIVCYWYEQLNASTWGDTVFEQGSSTIMPAALYDYFLSRVRDCVQTTIVLLNRKADSQEKQAIETIREMNRTMHYCNDMAWRIREELQQDVAPEWGKAMLDARKQFDAAMAHARQQGNMTEEMAAAIAQLRTALALD